MEFREVNKDNKIKNKKPVKKRKKTEKPKTVPNEEPTKKKYKSEAAIKRRHKILAIFLCVVLLVATLGILSFTVFFPIKTIKVTGNNMYSTQEIISSCGVIKGENLLAASESKTEKILSEKYPYIESVSFQRNLPFSLTIKVKESDVFAQIKIGKKYLSINENGKCLQLSKKYQKGSPVVTGVEVKNSVIGSNIEFVRDTSELNTIDEIIELQNTFKSNELNDITVINLESEQDIRVTYQNRIVLLFGSNVNMDKKISHAIATIKARENNDETGTLNLSRIPSTKNEASFIPKDLNSNEIAGKLK